MIGPVVSELLLENQETFLIPADNVATLMYQNPLSHALLVLSKVGYSKIPVLDKKDRFVGLIGLSDIVDRMINLTEINSDGLEGLTVADVMEVDVPTITEDWELEDVLHLLVNCAFLPVVDREGIFEGIITRKELLKAVNFLVHELEKTHTVLPKNKVTEAENLRII